MSDTNMRDITDLVDDISEWFTNTYEQVNPSHLAKLSGELAAIISRHLQEEAGEAKQNLSSLSDLEFNNFYPVGTPVRYYSVIGGTQYLITRTESAAWTLPSGEAVVKVGGVTGCVTLAALEIRRPRGECSDCTEIASQRDHLRAELAEAKEQAERLLSELVALKDNPTRAENPCKECGGFGRIDYPNTATYHAATIAGQAFTPDICNACWGSGEANRPYRNLRESEDRLFKTLSDARDTIRLLHKEKREDAEIAEQRQVELSAELATLRARSQEAREVITYLRRFARHKRACKSYEAKNCDCGQEQAIEQARAYLKGESNDARTTDS